MYNIGTTVLNSPKQLPHGKLLFGIEGGEKRNRSARTNIREKIAIVKKSAVHSFGTMEKSIETFNMTIDGMNDRYTEHVRSILDRLRDVGTVFSFQEKT
ncbi:hypothetical protein [Paenibacillus sp. CECT 9249]|uniref:hypothetical protein n=1 Tax=Paenibacillus sp. CECT 9249 TaxID=2845385 RepID=UPI001E54DC1E|nr:hypothetical protein [Paenibacillus sp. CECT 9249]